MAIGIFRLLINEPLGILIRYYIILQPAVIVRLYAHNLLQTHATRS